MKKLMLLVACFCLVGAAFAQVDKAKYYIEGDYSITQDNRGQFVYQLTNITSKGITFTPKEVIYGKVEPDESISFTFDKAETECPEGFEGGLKFWKWQYNGKDYSWQRDSEVKDAQQNFETDKVMVVMLVLDCSNSLGEANFEKLKNSATKFINILYNASPDGGIRLGVVGFNTMGNADKMVYNIEPLTLATRDEMIKFIQGLTLYNNTALYYAMRKGADMISTYVNKLPVKDKEKFDYACMVSFTDGYDNHSTDPALGLPEKGLENPYFKYVRDEVVNRPIQGAPLKSYVIAIKGNDVAENNQLYKSVFEGISSEEPFLLTDFSQLESQFETMAQELIKRWQNLTCYVPSAHQGKVRWTIGDYTDNSVNTKATEIKETISTARRDAFIGVNAGLNFEISHRNSFGLGLGFDFAVPIKTTNVAIGGLAALKYDFAGPLHLNLGALIVAGDYVHKCAFMGGLGFDLRFATATKGNNYIFDPDNNTATDNNQEFYWIRRNTDKTTVGGLLRLGVTTPMKNLYFFTDIALGRYKATYYPNASEPVEPYQMTYHTYWNVSLNVGYRFGN
ncbi:MAG: VWA domain-containing protein [Bacteroidales bacterium]|nr:VWA domain-containing protein [Bacteroidales bacterium]MBO7647695.1 VWA domain-containing protein [Bacteroidales bacterium]